MIGGGTTGERTTGGEMIDERTATCAHRTVLEVTKQMTPQAIQSEVIAVETHSGRLWGLVILAALVVPFVSVAFHPTGPARLALVLVAVIGAVTFAIAWGGFQYRFLQHGLEVRMLGFRLRSIPRSAVLSYSVEPWALIRGYGIRGIGTTRAYVWCNKVVHIHMSNGDVYLGHQDPERVVRDLDQMMGLVTRG